MLTAILKYNQWLFPSNYYFYRWFNHVVVDHFVPSSHSNEGFVFYVVKLKKNVSTSLLKEALVKAVAQHSLVQFLISVQLINFHRSKINEQQL